MALRRPVFLLAFLASLPAPSLAQRAERPAEIEAVLVHPFMARPFVCREHFEGQLAYLFDALGSDCVISVNGREYRTDGKTNEDYYIWGREVVAPFDGVVVQVTVNSVINEPGVLGKSPAGLIVFQRADSVQVMYAHIDSMRVAVGDTVRAGHPVARVSNNGMSRAPHVHIGGRRGPYPLQIRWDLRAMGELMRPKEASPR